MRVNGLWERFSSQAIFWKNTGIVMLIGCFPMIVIGLILYSVGTEHIRKEVDRSHRAFLQQSIGQIEESLSNFERFVVRIGFEPGFDESLGRTDFVQQFRKTNDLYKTLSLMQESYSLIDHVSLYLREADMLISDRFGLHRLEAKERQAYAGLLDREQLIYWQYGMRSPDKPDKAYSTVVVKLPGGQLVRSYGAILIYLDQKRLEAMVGNLSAEGSSVLMNEFGEELIAPGTGTDKELRVALKRKLAAEDGKEGTFNLTWNRRDYSVSYGTLSIFNSEWTVVSATPVSRITKPVTQISRLIIRFSTIGVLIGIVLSLLASRTLYAPIRRIRQLLDSGRDGQLDAHPGNEIVYIETQWKRHLEERQSLNKRIEQAIPAIREGFLLRFLQGDLYTHTSAEIRERLRQLDWDVDGRQFAFLTLQLHGLTELGNPYSSRDEQLITFAASNILRELCEHQPALAQIVNFQDLSLGVFLAWDRSIDGSAANRALRTLGESVISIVNKLLRVKATAVVSELTDRLTELPTIVERTRKALRYRNLNVDNQVFDMSKLRVPDRRQAGFPFELERQIVHAIGVGLEEEAAELVRRFLEELRKRDNTPLAVQQGMLKLLGTLHEMIIKYDVDIAEMYEKVHLYEELLRIREPDEMPEWFRKRVIGPVVRALSIAYDTELRSKVEQVLARIKDEFLQDISLEGYAAEFGIGPSRLSKAIKQMTGMNFIDHVMGLKLDHCKRRLLQSEMKIHEIAEQLHYQPSYLIRIFRKAVGMTPGQYREKHAASDLPGDNSP